jgi:hypothetical protein
MTRILAAIIALTAVASSVAASPVLADDVHISLAGKKPAVILAEINSSAKKLCRDLYRNDPFGPAAKMNCVRVTVSDAVSRLPTDLAQAINGEINTAKGGGAL